MFFIDEQGSKNLSNRRADADHLKANDPAATIG